ncbi:helix-turn-helix transcriptional regulator [Streptomyces sp. NPDC048566]|uniref:helix-turn-helix transcriptional regulator n=1 Tax=Streptomyces sp. NPDC048566 TaxID=3365569 RepID=UPI003718D6FD
MSKTESGTRPVHPAGPPDHNPFVALAELAPAAAFMRDRTGRYVWANHAYAHLYGTTRDAVIGLHLSDIDEPADVDRFLAMDRQVLTDGKSVRHTLTYRRPDGSRAHAAGYRFPAAWGSERCVAGIYVDVTDYVRATDQRHRAEADLRALRDHSGLACVRLTPDGRVSEAGIAAAEVLGVRLSDLTGVRADAFLSDPSEHVDLFRAWHDLTSGRRRSARASAVLVAGEGTQRRARVHLTAVGAPATGVTGVWAVATRLGRRRQTQPSPTPAQLRIITLLAAGRSNTDIAEELHLSRQTLDYHLSRLRLLLEAPTRPALVARAYVLGLLSPTAWPPRPPGAARPSGPV